MDKFWRNWQSRFSKRNVKPQHIDSLTASQQIADRFCEVFASGSFDSYTDQESIAKLNVKLSEVSPCSTFFTVSDIENAVKRLKCGKAPGFDGIVKEHIYYSHPAVIVYVMILFNIMSVHGFAPDVFWCWYYSSNNKESVG